MKKTFREIVRDPRLLSGFLAFAVAGVLAGVGGQSGSWVGALMCLTVACSLAIVAITLLTRPRKKKTIEPDTVKTDYRELVDVLGVTNETFIRFYLPLVEPLSPTTLAFAIRVVKRRRGVMLGSEKGQESVRRNRDRWTYAVFLAAISGVRGSVDERKTGLTQVLFSTPQAARDWLSREDLVIRTLIGALTAPDDRNPITRLVNDAVETVDVAVAAVRDSAQPDAIVSGDSPQAPAFTDRVDPTFEKTNRASVPPQKVSGFDGEFARKSTVS